MLRERVRDVGSRRFRRAAEEGVGIDFAYRGVSFSVRQKIDPAVIEPENAGAFFGDFPLLFGQVAGVTLSPLRHVIGLRWIAAHLFSA